MWKKSRSHARTLMEKLGYRPDKHLAVTVSTRNLAPYRDPAVILIDQLKPIYIDGVLDPLDTTQWYPKLMHKDYTLGLNVTETAVDDPDPGVLRELRVRGDAQLHRLLQPRARQNDR
jgi:peptide/nickel transport system substrate-binding protein